MPISFSLFWKLIQKLIKLSLSDKRSLIDDSYLCLTTFQESLSKQQNMIKELVYNFAQ